MADSVLMKGNEALAEAAIRAGCRHYFGYPITPQNEISEYMARRLRDEGGVFVQAESEVAAINMVYGAGGAGTRVMTSSSSPGVSLMQEGLSYIAGAEVPCVIVNMSRGGPGLGGIQPSQADYFQATKGGGHGDYRLVVYGPSSIQEACDLMFRAFDVADKYRTPVMILGDGNIGQMMEPVTFPEPVDVGSLPPKPWATTGRKGRERNNLINSIVLDPEQLDAHNWRLYEKYSKIKENEVMYEILHADDSEWFLVAYGTVSRICRLVVDRARKKGIKAGLIRPITLWPFPDEAFLKVIERAKGFLCVEMSTGQMVEDVRLAVSGRAPVRFYGRTGGAIPNPRQIEQKLTEMVTGGEAQ
ncbi:MAG TPA: 3-methyl-2-oxobutanoate dehydrogenase subunit VorB [Firmicutes bacterium]|nr:3-methyl-2-oxobutanoate dehydrogenase subunit VorB [Candidatus Fermentithermobacillaceae bacterium]